jgi:hypothetical protein
MVIVSVTYMSGASLAVELDGRELAVTGVVMDDCVVKTIGLSLLLDTSQGGPPEVGVLRVTAGDEVLYEGQCTLEIRKTTARVEEMIRELWIYQDGEDKAAAEAMGRALARADEESRRIGAMKAEARHLARLIEAQGILQTRALDRIGAELRSGVDRSGLALAAVLGAITGVVLWWLVR